MDLLLSLVLVASSSIRAQPIDSQAPGEHARACIARVEDADGDGRPDFALARRHLRGFGFMVKPPSIALERVWIISSSTGEVIRDLAPKRKATDFGHALVDLGDTDGDGSRDLAVAGARALWVYSGRDGSLLHELGGPLAGTGFARVITAGHDADGDDRPDVAVYRSPSGDGSLEDGGIVALYSGATGQLLRGYGTKRNSDWSKLIGKARWIELESAPLVGAIAFCRDRDGDRRAELAIATRVDPTESRGFEAPCRVTVVDALNGHRFLEFQLIKERAWRPWILSALPDIDADRVDEFFVSSVDSYFSIYSGSDANELRSQKWGTWRYSGMGTSFAVLGDVNGDQVADYVIAANESDLDCDDGLVSLFCGRTGECVTWLNLTHDDMRAAGMPSGCGPGADVCALGDVDGDAIPDALVAIPRLDQLRILSGKDFRELRRFAISPITEPRAEVPPPASAPSPVGAEAK